MGSDGDPWVWVMGEHPDDKSIEEILEEEAKEAARKQAERETEQFRLETFFIHYFNNHVIFVM